MTDDAGDGRVVLLVARLVARMRVSPSPAAAAASVADADDETARRLAVHVRDARGTDRTGLRAFATECGTPGVERAMRLVESAGSAPPAERERALDRAAEAVVEGVRESVATAAADLRGPATAVYAFGVLLPLALVAALPAAQVAGLPVGLPAVVLVYDLLLPAGLLWASARLLARRPVAFPSTAVGRDHPDVPDRPWRALLAGVAVGAAGTAVAALALPAWTVPLTAVGGGTGAALVVGMHPYVAVHEAAEEREAGLPDALALVGSRVAEGEAVESALASVAADLGGPTGAALAAASDRGRHRGCGVRAAVEGSLAEVPSVRFDDAARLLGAATREGRPAGKALVAFGDHLAELRRVEREARRDLRRVTATLSNTAAVFGPLVGGATVALAGALARHRAVPTAGLGLAVGAYVLVLAAVLAALSTTLERGPRPAVVGRRVGTAVLSATATYLVAFAAARLLT